MLCSVYGKEHPAEAMELSYRRPDETAALSDRERSELVQESADLSILKGERFFVRAVLPLPVQALVRPYNIGLWVEVLQPAFERIYALWNEPTQATEPLFEARIANDLPFMRSTCGTPAQLRLSGPTTRPEVFVSPMHESLYEAQAKGITLHRASEYSAFYAEPEV